MAVVNGTTRTQASQLKSGSAFTIPSNIANACQGWQAVYETFSVGDAQSRVISLTRIPLDPKDIELCLWQSLRFSPLHHWRCYLELTISPDLTRISIPNRIIYIQPDHQNYYNARLLFGFHHKDAWLGQQKPVIPYRYHIYWDTSSRYLAYVGDDSFSSSLGIFDTSATNEAEELVLLSRAAFNTPSICNVSFHPFPPIFMFQAERFVFLWNFLEGMWE